MQTYRGRPANLNRGSERIPIFRAAVDSIISARIREGHRQGILVLRSPCSRSIITAINPLIQSPIILTLQLRGRHEVNQATQHIQR